MKINRPLQFLAVTSIAVAISCISCKDDNDCIGGSGGSLTIVAKLEHHGINIPNDSLQPDTVWVKYNASDWGNAPQGYDMRVIGVFPEDHVHIEGLKCGKYYLYASGWDTSINMEVKGGIPYETEESSGEVVVKIPVVE
ncbi:MAG: hypothetical protein RIQ47_1393 [Bacteroidota bacterium]|jgi:hypothetical protein